MSSTILATILYWMFGLNPNVATFFTWVGFFILTIRCVLCCLLPRLLCCDYDAPVPLSVGSALLYFGGSISPSPSVANSLVSVILMFVM